MHFPNDKQVMIAEKLQGLFAVDCHSDAERPDERNSVEVRRDNLHITFREALFAATKAGTFEELDAMFAKALEDYETGLKHSMTKLLSMLLRKQIIAKSRWKSLSTIIRIRPQRKRTIRKNGKGRGI